MLADWSTEIKKRKHKLNSYIKLPTTVLTVLMVNKKRGQIYWREQKNSGNQDLVNGAFSQLDFPKWVRIKSQPKNAH